MAGPYRNSSLSTVRLLLLAQSIVWGSWISGPCKETVDCGPGPHAVNDNAIKSSVVVSVRRVLSPRCCVFEDWVIRSWSLKAAHGKSCCAGSRKTP